MFSFRAKIAKNDSFPAKKAQNECKTGKNEVKLPRKQQKTPAVITTGVFSAWMWGKPTNILFTGIPIRDRPPAFPMHRRSNIPKTVFGRPDSRAAATDRSPCRRRHGDACLTTGFPIAGQLNRMGRRFKRHRPSGYPRFLYPYTFHSQLPRPPSPRLHTPRRHFRRRFTVYLRSGKPALSTASSSLCIPRTEVKGTDARVPHAARVLSRFKERCPKALNAL